jgi:hypothetical protein
VEGTKRVRDIDNLAALKASLDFIEMAIHMRGNCTAMEAHSMDLVASEIDIGSYLPNLSQPTSGTSEKPSSGKA